MGTVSTAVAAGLQQSPDCYQLYIRTPSSILLSAAPRMATVSLPKSALGGIHALHISVAVKCCSDFPKLCFFMLCYVTLCICLYSCPIKHVLVESGHSAREIRSLFLLPTFFPLYHNAGQRFSS